MYLNIVTEGGKLFKGGNYSRVETSFIKGLKREETVQRRKLYKGGYYTMKYCMCFYLKKEWLGVQA